MKTAHTPGPWEVNGSLVVKDCYSGVICDTEISINFHHKRYVPLDVCKANARLIAAAPELMEASRKTLQGIAQLCETVNGLSSRLGLGEKVRFEDFAEHLQKALAKARGEN